MGFKRNSISYNGGKLPIYNDASAAVGGEISIASSLSNQLLINELNGNGVLVRLAGANKLRIAPDDHIQIFAPSGVGVIGTDTTDGSDNKIITVTGASTSGPSRSGYISLYGNEASGHPASVVAVLGSTTGSFKIIGNNGAVVRHEFSNDGNVILSGNSATGGDAIIRSNSSDASDTGRIRLCGGGAFGSSRGASITVSGNEASSTGDVYIETGAVSGAHATVNVASNANVFQVQIAGTNVATLGSANSTLTPQQRPAGNTVAYTLGAVGGLVFPNVTTTGTNYNKVVEIYGNDAPISASAVDSGYRIGVAVQQFLNQATFAGTLQDLYGAWIRAGTNSAAPTGTINNVIAVFAEVLKGANTPFGNSYGFYQISNDTNTKNYFQNRLGIGTNNPGVPLDITITNATANLRITDSTNGARVQLIASSVTGHIYNSGGAIEVGTVSSHPVHISTVNTLRWIFRTDGHLAPNLNNAYSVGVSGAKLAELWATTVRPEVIRFADATNGDIFQNTADAADNRRVRIGGGGDVATSRGGFIELTGNESTQYDGAGGGQIILRAGSLATGYVRVETGGSNRWEIDGTNGYLLGMSSEKLIGTRTNSGSDNTRLTITGSGGIDTLRGATITLYGNNNSGAEGILDISAGNNATNSRISFNTQGVERWRIQPNGRLAATESNSRLCGINATNRILSIIADQDAAASSYLQLMTDDTQGGNALLQTGVATNASLTLGTRSSAGSINIATNSVNRIVVASDGSFTHKNHANYTNSGTERRTIAANTTDATTANLYTKTLLDNTLYKFVVDVVGRFNSTTAKGVWGRLEFGVYRNNGGAATLAGTRLKVIDTYGSSGYDFDVDVSSNDVRVRITGAASETVSWTADIKIIAVTTAS